MAQQKSSGPRRFYVCGIPLTYEILLRFFLFAVTVGLLVYAAIPKVTSILDKVNYVSVKVVNASSIAVPDILICGLRLETTELDMVEISDVDGGVAKKQAVDPAFYEIKNATAFKMQAYGDWPEMGKCVHLKRQENLLYKKTQSNNNAALAKIVFALTAAADIPPGSVEPYGLSLAIWDGDVPVTLQQPIWASTPSINTLTFVYTEHLSLKGDKQVHYTLQRQNLRPMTGGFGAKKIIAKVEISPDSFYVNQYIDQKGYTWVDLLGAVGGMASIALALWIFLFGSGKYKSWGIMQRYVLQTSPNSRRYRKDEAPPKNAFVAFHRFIKKQFSRLDSNADNDLDNMPLHPDPRRHSLRYSTAVNTAAAVAGKGSFGAGGGHGNGNNNNSNNNNGDLESARSSMDLQSGNFYFSEHGAPGSRSLQPLAPINDNEELSEEQEVEELIRLIDLRIDERMWSLEKTLSRFYLDGFRLRNYSTQYSAEAGAYAAAAAAAAVGAGAAAGNGGGGQGKDEEFKSDKSSPYSTDRNSRMELLDGGGSGEYTPPLSTPPAPAYPPRPQVSQHYAYLGENQQQQPASQLSLTGGPGMPQVHTASPISPNRSEIEQAAGPGQAQHLPAAADGSHFVLDLPQRKNMRGTIRRAVERLQNEWPQSRAQDVYVPRTQYGGPGTNNNSRSNLGQGQGQEQQQQYRPGNVDQGFP
ncbi:hypothetical protein BGX29_011879 [Mortierella sp. GBA35]|nr:hypothetical protein BGX29_011879 [Mortierella sp. GBA35]